MDPKEISYQLRLSQDKAMQQKRNLALLSSIGLLDFIIISLYQLGVIKRLPDIKAKYFDSNYVNASPEAYKMGVPDGPVSAVIYAVILALIGIKGTSKKERENIWDYLLGGAIVANAAGAAQYLYIMIFKQKRICLYCVTGAIINFIMLKIFLKMINKK